MKHSQLPIGFHPVPNRRLAAMAAEEAVRLMFEGAEPFAAEAMALRSVALKLSPLPFARRHRAPKPSKSDDPTYRKSGHAAKLV